jgi:hypothetical protein
VEQIQLAEDMGQYWVFVNTVMNFQVPQNGGDEMSYDTIYHFSRSTIINT